MANNCYLYYKKLGPNAMTPYKGTKKSVGYDLYSPYDFELAPNAIVSVKTDLAFQFPDYCYGRITSRSSLARHGIHILGGVIDPDFTGNVTVVLRNSGSNTMYVMRGQRFAQIICERAEFPILKEEFGDFETSERNSNGFGSTGIF